MSDRGVHRVDVPDRVVDADPLGRSDHASAFRLWAAQARIRTPELIASVALRHRATLLAADFDFARVAAVVGVHLDDASSRA